MQYLCVACVAYVIKLAACARRTTYIQKPHFHHAVQPAANHARALPAAAPQSERRNPRAATPPPARASAPAVRAVRATGFKASSTTIQTSTTEEKSSVGLALNPSSSACSDDACKSSKGSPVNKVNNSYEWGLANT